MLNETGQVSDYLDAAKQFSEDDFIKLMDGKKVKGLKFNKNKKREIKHAVKRGEVNCLKFLLFYTFYLMNMF